MVTVATASITQVRETESIRRSGGSGPPLSRSVPAEVMGISGATAIALAGAAGSDWPTATMARQPWSMAVQPTDPGMCLSLLPLMIGPAIPPASTPTSEWFRWEVD